MESGLSVLIPIYDLEVKELVNSLLYQLRDQQIPFEILCYDDASPGTCKEANNNLFDKADVIYKELPKNLGRSKIRNLMAEEAKFDKLLFLDCDSAVVKNDFISTYWEQREAAVTYGGTVYLNRPKDSRFLLHYLVGKDREERSAVLRKQNPYRGVTFNNIMVSRSLMLSHPLQNMNGYGHEDTLFGMEMQKAGIAINHIDNPVDHLGLEESPVFIGKSRQAAKNLAHIYRDKGLGTETGIVKSYVLLQKMSGLDTFLNIYKRLERLIIRNLNGPRPRLRYFDTFKLAEFCREIKRGAE